LALVIPAAGDRDAANDRAGDRRSGALTAAFVGVGAFLVYLRTCAPAVTFWDSGELATCARTLGISHPPGTPVYVLVGRLFSLVPIGSDIAGRLNFLSAIFGALAVSFAFLVTDELIAFMRRPEESRITARVAAAVGALAFAFSQSHWRNSVEAEVYAPATFLTAVTLWCVLRWTRGRHPGNDRWILLAAYLVGLGIATHPLIALTLPALLALVYFRRHAVSARSALSFGVAFTALGFAVYPGLAQWLPSLAADVSPIAAALPIAALGAAAVALRRRRRRGAVLAAGALLFVVLGFSVYGTIPVRARFDPPINEGDPGSAERLARYANREQYGSWSITDRRAPFWEYQVGRMYVRYLGWQFVGRDASRSALSVDPVVTPAGLWAIPGAFGLAGMLVHFRRDWRRAVAIALLFLMTGLAIVIYVNHEAPQVRERDYSYVGSFFAVALWVGVGAWGLLRGLERRVAARRSRPAVVPAATAVVLALVPGKMLLHNFPWSDRSGDYVARDFGDNVLATCEPNAILFTYGDNTTYPLWYLQHVAGFRTDVSVISLTLLSESWYVRQVRDRAPAAPVSLSDHEIDVACAGARPRTEEVIVEIPEGVRTEWLRRIGARDVGPDRAERVEMRIPLDAGSIGRRAWPQDVIAAHIIAENRFRRPVHFVVTAHPQNTIGLGAYLRLRGLVFDLAPFPVTEHAVDVDALATNVLHTYRYRPPDQALLLADLEHRSFLDIYRRGFVVLAERWAPHVGADSLRSILSRMEEIAPEGGVPLDDGTLEVTLGRLWERAGKEGELRRRLTRVLAELDLITGDRFLVLASLLQPAELPAGEAAAREVLADRRASVGARAFLIAVGIRQGNLQDAMREVTAWLARDPRDRTANRLLQTIRGAAGQLQGRLSRVGESDDRLSSLQGPGGPPWNTPLG
jgi:4-amino-4-deoxy-L-arabinose transferase-like glycosyltransferase